MLPDEFEDPTIGGLVLDRGPAEVAHGTRAGAGSLGIPVQYATGGSGVMKPFIEAFQGAFTVGLLGTLDGFKGPNRLERAHESTVKRVLRLADIAALYERYVVDVVHRTPRRELALPGTLTPRTPNQALYAALISQPIPHADKHDPARVLALLDHDTRRLSHKGISVDGVFCSAESTEGRGPLATLEIGHGNSIEVDVYKPPTYRPDHVLISVPGYPDLILLRPSEEAAQPLQDAMSSILWGSLFGLDGATSLETPEFLKSLSRRESEHARLELFRAGRSLSVPFQRAGKEPAPEAAGSHPTGQPPGDVPTSTTGGPDDPYDPPSDWAEDD